MARWTKSYKVPIRVKDSISVAVGKEIWILSIHYKKAKQDVAIFNTETRAFTTAECQLPESVQTDRSCSYHASYDDQIYDWISNDRGSYDWNGEIVNQLYRLDTKTMEWKHILTTDKEYASCVVIGDFMYVLDRPGRSITCKTKNETDALPRPTFLDTIDLKNKEVIDSYELIGINNEASMKLTSNDRKLYLIDTFGRSVSIIEDRKVRVLHEDKYKIEQEPPGNALWRSLKLLDSVGFDQGVFYQWSGNNSILGLDTFNYSENKWKRTISEKNWHDIRQYARECLFFEFDGVFYAVLNSLNVWSWKEIRLLEKSPDPSTLNLLNMIDFCVDNNEMDRLKECGENVREDQKNDWKSMINWRLKEHEIVQTIQLTEVVAEAAKKEGQKMVDEGLIGKNVLDSVIGNMYHSIFAREDF